MTQDPRAGLEAVTEDQLERCAHLLAGRVGLEASLGGKDAVDFIQEALGKILSGERSLQPGRPLEENLISIGQSLVWNERKKHREVRLPEEDLSSEDAARFDADTLVHLYIALVKVQAVLEEIGETHRIHRDARAFVKCLIRQVDRGESIKPGTIGRLLGWRPARAYGAWRKVKSVLRDQVQPLPS